MTQTKKMSKKSEPLGPFSHIRICSEFVFASESSVDSEDVVAWFNSEIDLWTLEKTVDDIDKGYYEIIIATQPE